MSLVKLLTWEIKREAQDAPVTVRSTRSVHACSLAWQSCAYSVIKVLVLGMSFHCMGLSKKMPSPMFGAGSCLVLIRFLILRMPLLALIIHFSVGCLELTTSVLFVMLLWSDVPAHKGAEWYFHPSIHSSVAPVTGFSVKELRVSCQMIRNGYFPQLLTASAHLANYSGVI